MFCACFQTCLCNAGYSFFWIVVCSVPVFRWACGMLVIVFAGLWTVICSGFRWVYLMLVTVLAGLLFCICFQAGLRNAGLYFLLDCCFFCVCFQTDMRNAGYSFCWTVDCNLFCF